MLNELMFLKALLASNILLWKSHTLPTESDIHQLSSANKTVPTESDIHQISSANKTIPTKSDIHQISSANKTIPTESDIHQISSANKQNINFIVKKTVYKQIKKNNTKIRIDGWLYNVYKY